MDGQKGTAEGRKKSRSETAGQDINNDSQVPHAVEDRAPEDSRARAGLALEHQEDCGKEIGEAKDRQPSEEELEGARYQGRRIAETALKLHG